MAKAASEPDPAAMRPGDQQLGGDDHADSGVSQQLRCPLLDHHGELAFQLVDFGRQGEHAAGGGPQREHTSLVAGTAMWAAAQLGADTRLGGGRVVA
jgi:hypothetical protein